MRNQAQQWLRERSLTLALAGFISAFSIHAEADEVKLNVRELCRLEVASQLLQAYNDIAILKDQVLLGEQKIKDFAIHIGELDQEQSKVKAKPSGTIPAIEVEEKLQSLRYQLQTLRAQELETEQHLTQNKQNLKEQQQKREAFEKLIKPVFAFDLSSDDGKVGLPQKIRYHQVCGPYQLLCPLPREQIQGLKKIALSLENNIPCERYSAISPSL